MIPISLTIKGLYSYQKEQKIDFEKLLEGQLFGIFGAVGSGKSSILEAISYALFGETERLNKTDYRSYNMMNLKSDELLIDFIFKNHDGINYRFVVRGKRNPKNFEKVNTLERSAYKESNNEWIPLESASGENVIGLSYDNFRRTIIIPQGKFQEFLQLKEKDRTDMLKEIFSLDKYDFFFQSASLEKKNSHAMLDLQGQLKMYSELSTEIILEQESIAEAIKASLTNTKIDLDIKEKVLKEQLLIQQLFNDYNKAEHNLKEIQQQEPSVLERENRVKNYEYCFINFNDLLQRKKTASNSLEQRQQLHLNLIKELDNLINDLKNKDLLFKEVGLEYDKLDFYKDKINDFELILNILNLREDTKNLSSRIKDGSTFIEKSLVERDELQKIVESLVAEIKVKKSNIPDLAKLAAIKSWYNGKSYVIDILTKSESQLNHPLQQLKQLENEVQELNNVLNLKLSLTVEDIELYVKSEQEKKYLEQEKVYNLIRHYEVQSKMADFSKSITEGEPCPLCGSNHHPNVLVADDVIDHLNIAKLNLDSIKNEIDDLNEFSRKISVLKIKNEAVNHQISDSEKVIADNKIKYNNYLKTFNWPEFKEVTEKDISSLFEDAQKLNRDIVTLETSLEEAGSKHKKAEEAYQKYKTAIDKIHADLSAKELQIDFFTKQLKQLTPDLLTKPEVEVYLLETKTFVIKTQNDYKDLKEFTEKANHNKLVLSEKIRAVLERLREEESILTGITKSLNELLENSVYHHLKEVEEVLNQQLNLEELKNDIKVYHQQLYSAKELFDKLKKQVEGKDFTVDNLELLTKEFDDLNEYFKIQNDDFIRASVKLTEQKKNYETKLLLEQKLYQLELRAADINVLKNMFKANGFISYISTVYLNQLCEAANERFYKLSRQQLRLEITDKNNFEVRDYLNDGHLRSVKTLSGGQTFQASLSLALALAESVQHQNNAQQNFFFLDEGFGSLDKESLQTALETLKSLRKENRIVGVISHVEELQQEIDVFLSVSNNSSEGSRVKGNWE